MKDITPILDRFISFKGDWAHVLFYQALDCISSYETDVAFWDGEENWASIANNGELIGYLWQKYPLTFMEKAYKDVLSTCLNPLYVVEVSSLKRDQLFANEKLLWELFEFESKSIYFTAEDLWFSTNPR